jgi:hypothetical protein
MSSGNGPLRGYMKNCLSFYNRNDDYDYIGTDIFMFEWYCKGGKHTWSGTDINVSTAHTSTKLIRVGGDYRYSMGKPVQDINNCRTLSIGCVAGYSQAADPNNYAYASNSSTGTVEMWLYECQHVGPAGRGFHNFNNSTMNIYDGSIGNLLTATNREDVGSVLNEFTENDVFV